MTKTNPLLDGIDLPGVTVALPSMGQWYKPEVLVDGADPGSIMVNSYSLIDEMGFKDPYKIMSGKALSGLLARSCPEILKADELLTMDAEVLMAAARQASHGNEVEVFVTCQNPELIEKKDKNGNIVKELCGEQTPVSIRLDVIVAGYDPQSVGLMEEWQVKMKNGQTVQTMPIKYIDAIEATKGSALLLRELRGDSSRSVELEERIYGESFEANRKILSSMVHWISTADGTKIFDRKQIAEWVEMVPSAMMDLVIEKMEERSQKIKHFGKAEFVCPRCEFSPDGGTPIISDPQHFFGKGSSSAKAS